MHAAGEGRHGAPIDCNIFLHHCSKPRVHVVFFEAQGKLVGRKKRSSLTQGRLETIAKLKLYHLGTEMMKEAK